MKTYKIYRSIRASNAESIDFSNIGISWAQSYDAADRHAEQFGEDYIIIESIVDESAINIPQTNAQWESEHANECEVVLFAHVDLSVILNGDFYNANTGASRNDETRPQEIDCDPDSVLDYLELL